MTSLKQKMPSVRAAPSRTVEVNFQLMYWPEESYRGIAPGATFTLREGPNVVGFGSILSEIETPSS
jgi:hypothetical protein